MGKTLSLKYAILIPIFLLTLCCFPLIHCSNPNIDAPRVDSVHPSGWAYPNHGIYVDVNGTDSCKPCHGNSLQGNGDIRGCANVCHFGLNGETSPSGSDWLHGSTPHVTLLPYGDVCNQCHNTMRQYHLGPDECHDCHGQGISHPLGQVWLDRNSADFHGQSSLNCSSCHNLATYCYECHFGASGSKVPSGSNWTHGNENGHDNFESFQSICNRCHNLNRSYGYPPSSCHDCHDDDD